MRILHTADWHLGARLVERSRHDEHVRFLDWLITTLREENIDALLISGDVFDAANPPQEAISLYFDFIKRLADLKTIQTIITGGNHDSASHLNAPRELLKRFNVHVFGHAENTITDLGDAIVAAVPFLRERDLRQAGEGQPLSTVDEQLRQAIRRHYADQLARCQVIAKDRPIIAMGHLTVAGAATTESERDIHIGNLGAVGAGIFEGFHYTALGHLHRPQKVGDMENVRYSGSPIALSFSEAADVKSVVVLDTDGMQLALLPIPSSRRLTRITVDRSTLHADLQNIPVGSWAEVTVPLTTPEPDLDRLVRDAAEGRFDVLKVLAALPATQNTGWQTNCTSLNDLQPREVFLQLLKERGHINEELQNVFDELLALQEQRLTA